ncbi:MAG: hypothetical protein J7K73_03910 [Nanoarchaeota archaeon]|nr:hypothetical protein [Nanoarchaeota archaeon]
MRRILAVLLILFFVLGTASAARIVDTKIIGVTETESGEVKGVVANLTVELHNGTGRVFVYTNPLTQIDTQASARLAKEVACSTLDINCSRYDFFYIINSDSEIIGGPSAGAAMTIATMAALQNVSLRENVYITGTINPAGSIGPVGEIFKKAEAAYGIGAKVFLVPKGESKVYDEETGEYIDLALSAEKSWDMSIVEVDNIADAYTYFTGYVIEVPKVTSAEIASKKYNEVMKSLSESLLEYSEKLFVSTEGKFNSSTINVDVSDDLEVTLLKSKDYLSQAKESYSRGDYYSSSSFSVRSLIYSNYVNYAVDYYENGENSSFVESKIAKVNRSISAFEALFLRNMKIDDYGDIEVYSVVIDRIREAEDIAKAATSAYNDEDYDKALYLAAFAEVRKNTAYDWLLLISKFEGNLSLEFNLDNLRSVAQERIQESKTYITYASTVTEGQVLDEARIHISKAIDAYNSGKYIFALFEASKARANANLAMEIRAVTNDTVQYKINELIDDSRLAIKRAEEKGLLPILALSYLEFGKTLRNKDPLQALIYISYSKEMAQISEDLFYATTGQKLVTHNSVIIKKPSIVEDTTLKSLYLLLTGTLFGALLALYIKRK